MFDFHYDHMLIELVFKIFAFVPFYIFLLNFLFNPGILAGILGVKLENKLLN